ncbi:hypothetical protein ACFP65_01820 [Marinilactibacillus sp. GCM10026970]|uniref:hypothetical protein n=1 Tax=Marinilactibacillus sp. GCM10026970 TaxID=3252642 RepID=UPI00361BB71F
MTLSLFVMIVALLLLNMSKQKEITRLKSLFQFDRKELEDFAKETFKIENDQIKTIKLLRKKYYPLDLLTAKRIVDKVKQ